jgi:type II secretory pathway predicted ATPase ExeA
VSVNPFWPAAGSAASLKLLEEVFGELGRVIPVLLLDEAQHYAMGALEEIRMLLGLNLPEQPAFALILVGDPYLLSTLRLRSHRALYSRIPRTINLVARAAWIQAAKDKSLQISVTHLQSALELVPGVMDIRQNSSPP